MEELHQLNAAVKESLFAFKNGIIIQKIQGIQEQLKEESDPKKVGNLLKDQMKWEKIRGVFAKNIGRIIG